MSVVRLPVSSPLSGRRNLIRPKRVGSQPNSEAYKIEQAGLAVSLGLQLTEWRREAGLTQQQVGDVVGVKPPQVSAWESGKQTVREGHIDLYARVLGVPKATLAQTILRHTQPLLYAAIFG